MTLQAADAQGLEREFLERFGPEAQERGLRPYAGARSRSHEPEVQALADRALSLLREQLAPAAAPQR